MIGCMVSATSLAMAPALILAQGAEFVPTWTAPCCWPRIAGPA